MNQTGRIDVVFIRKSTEAQETAGQRANVDAMLKTQGVYVPERHWFLCTVPRAKVQGNTEFKRLKGLVEADRVGTVYVESQDRWGTGDTAELFTLLGLLADHNTRLYDLRDKVDLTGKDDATEMRVFLGSFKSKKEREDLAYRSMRSKVQSFMETGSWPTGTHPYGYGKSCLTADGKLLWTWVPTDRTRGQVYYPDADGGLKPVGGPDAPLPHKDKRDLVKLTPGRPEYVQAVKLVFDLYGRVGLSRRKISARLNAEGFTFNGSVFTHPDVTNILRNPAYAGDTHYGKTAVGRHFTFDPEGLLVKVVGKRGDKRRDAGERLIREDTHEPLIDQKTWTLAQEKLAAERERVSHSPRNPAYYLKQLFVCGHCGKGMAARTERYPGTDKRVVVYVCSSYVAGRCNGHAAPCGYHRISHDDAERLLLDKIKELNLPFDDSSLTGLRAGLQARLERLGRDDEDFVNQVRRFLSEGLAAFGRWLVDNYGLKDYREVGVLKKWAMEFYLGKSDYGDLSLRRMSAELTDLRSALLTAETAAVQAAKERLQALRDEHKALTLAWAKASGMQQAVLKQEIERLETEIVQWQGRTTPLSERFRELDAADDERQAERDKLMAEWPTLEAREKGEALRRLFKTVTLYWERTFHPAAAKPTRPRKTDRPGRYGYTLQRDRVAWSFPASDLDNSW